MRAFVSVGEFFHSHSGGSIEISVLIVGAQLRVDAKRRVGTHAFSESTIEIGSF